MMQSDFRFFKLSLGSRLILAGAFFVAGVEIQIASSTFNGLPVAALGWLFLMLRSATNKPDDRGLEQWRPVPVSEIDRLDDGLRQSKDLRKKTRNWADTLGLRLGLPLLIGFRAVTAFADREDYWLAGLDFAFFLVPAIFFGRIKVFAPPAIEMKMPCFRAFLSKKLPEAMAVAPYVRFDKDKSGADIPEDLRMLVELKRPPADLVGVQIQAAINHGPAGNVPYLYAVVLSKGRSGCSYQTAEQLQIPGYLVDAKTDGDYGTVVIRQEGYATGPDDCVELQRICVEVLTSIAMYDGCLRKPA
jgi:hypothetical protein